MENDGAMLASFWVSVMNVGPEWSRHEPPVRSPVDHRDPDAISGIWGIALPFTTLGRVGIRFPIDSLPSKHKTYV